MIHSRLRAAADAAAPYSTAMAPSTLLYDAAEALEDNARTISRLRAAVAWLTALLVGTCIIGVWTA